GINIEAELRVSQKADLTGSHTGPNVQYCFQDRNSSCIKAFLSTSIYITLYIFFSLISAVTVFLNLLVIISISHFKQLHTTTNLLILSLAASDLLVGLIVIPVMTVATMEPCWGFGEYFCVFHTYIACLSPSLSLGNLVLISIDRYVAVCDPLLYHSKITTTRITCCISITWCCCIIYRAANIKYFVNVQVPRSRCLKEFFIVEGIISVNIIYIVITMVVPCSIIITLYMKIFVVARSQARTVFSKEAASVSCVKTLQANKSKRKAAKTLSIVVFNYFICWIPFLFSFFLYFLIDMFLSYFLIFLPIVNSLINPIIYAFFYPWFKVTAKLFLNLKIRLSNGLVNSLFIIHVSLLPHLF
uniref:G-protein coupled receptors family 1 profile domain-containing protein n=1 Tax=Oncorhynchus mykiss TaxID=8022 RepID=A0A8C7QRL6_ONCMY